VKFAVNLAVALGQCYKRLVSNNCQSSIVAGQGA